MMRFSAVVLLAIAPVLSWAHEEHHDHASHADHAAANVEYPWGRPGVRAASTRTIAIDMADTMRFTPAQVKVKPGETVTFALSNTGKVLHEMVIGTAEELQMHAEHMRKDPGMEHHAPYMVHVPPGEKRSLAWTFTRPGTFLYGCLIPGHWEAGMKGTIVVAKP